MKGKPMKKTTTWLASAMIVAAAAAGCSVTVTEGDGGTTGGSGGTGGSTGGSGGTGGTTGGTAGTGGSGGTAGAPTDGGGGTGGGDAGMPMCTTNPNDPVCVRCGFNNCMDEACACAAHPQCRAAMTTFNNCIGAPNADLEACAVTFIVNANVDGGGSYANPLATCMADKCFDTCQMSDAGRGG